MCGGRIVSTSSRNYHGVQNWIGETGFSRARPRSLGATRLFVFPSRKLVLSALFRALLWKILRCIKRNRVNRIGGLRKRYRSPSIDSTFRDCCAIRICFLFFFFISLASVLYSFITSYGSMLHHRGTTVSRSATSSFFPTKVDENFNDGASLTEEII